MNSKHGQISMYLQSDKYHQYYSSVIICTRCTVLDDKRNTIAELTIKNLVDGNLVYELIFSQ